jgi:hypothetical protein
MSLRAYDTHDVLRARSHEDFEMLLRGSQIRIARKLGSD